MSRQRSRQSHRQSDQPATKNTSQLQMRPFASMKPPQTGESQTTNLQPQTETVPQSDFSLGQVNLFPPGETLSPTSIKSPVQAKLTIGQPGDRYEQEADQVASQVVQQINSPQTAQREGDIQRSPLINHSRLPLQRQSSIPVGPASDEFERSLNSARSGGSALQPKVQAQMESAMGADFSGVKVHTDAQADQLNRSIQSKAFTTGQDLFFRQGAYDPGSRGGQELIAHELTHVVQQNGSAVQRKPENEDPLIDGEINNGQKTKPQKGHDQYKFFGGSGKHDPSPTKSSEENEEEKLKHKVSHSSSSSLSTSTKLKRGTSGVIQREDDTIQRDTDKVFHMDDKGVGHDQPKRVFHMDSQGVAHEHPDPKASTSITKLSTPGPNLTNAIDPDDFGMCDTETVTPFLNAYKEGSVWRAAVYKFEGEYSFLARLPNTYYEVTGPGGNTTLNNSMGQIKALHHLGEDGPDCYMVGAVDAHEQVHESRLAPALEDAEPAMQSLFTAITVPDGGDVKDKHSAINAIEKTPEYAVAVSRLRNIWDREYLRLIDNDHNVLTPAAEHAVVDPMIARINQFRIQNGRSAVNYAPYP